MSLANEGVTATVLDRLAALHAAATPGRWIAATAPSADSSETHAEYLVGALRPDEGRPLWVTWAPVVDGLHDDSDYVVPVVTGDGPTSEANAVFVANAHDALPRLLAAIRAAYGLHVPSHGYCVVCDVDRDVEAVGNAFPCDHYTSFCRACDTRYPCRTVAALDEALEVPGA